MELVNSTLNLLSTPEGTVPVTSVDNTSFTANMTGEESKTIETSGPKWDKSPLESVGDFGENSDKLTKTWSDFDSVSTSNEAWTNGRPMSATPYEPVISNSSDIFWFLQNCTSDDPFDCINQTYYTNCTYNDTSLCWNSTTNGTIEGDIPPPKYWAVILVLFPLFTLFGNILVVLSVFKEKQLRTATNYFIVSLAIADIMVAVLVMPLAVWVEMMNGVWTFRHDALCDAWVAFDVTSCTASILNLTAISVDRFFAVTRPLKYARNSNNNRVYITIAVAWVISVGIGSPIALGANTSESRTAVSCIFYNSDFLIWSSVGSFYIPCIVMIILYWRIFKVIHERAKKARAAKKKIPASSKKAALIIKDDKDFDSNKNSTQMITNTTEKTALNEINGGNNGIAVVVEEGSSSQTDDNIVVRSPTVESEIWVRRESYIKQNLKLNGTLESDHKLDSKDNLITDSDKDKIVPNNGPPKRTFPTLRIPFFPRSTQKSQPVDTVVYSKEDNTGQKISVKFKFHLPKRKPKGKKDLKGSRERKATKTLAIVLGAFLVCWVPFFTVNIINAFCIRYKLNISACSLDPILGGMFLWLGYLNSFLNPVIYTIFNIEFRKAFKKLLTQPCGK